MFLESLTYIYMSIDLVYRVLQTYIFD